MFRSTRNLALTCPDSPVTTIVKPTCAVISSPLHKLFKSEMCASDKWWDSDLCFRPPVSHTNEVRIHRNAKERITQIPFLKCTRHVNLISHRYGRRKWPFACARYTQICNRIDTRHANGDSYGCEYRFAYAHGVSDDKESVFTNAIDANTGSHTQSV